MRIATALLLACLLAPACARNPETDDTGGAVTETGRMQDTSRIRDTTLTPKDTLAPADTLPHIRGPRDSTLPGDSLR